MNVTQTSGQGPHRPMAVGPFDFDPRTRIVFGCGMLSQLGELTAQYGGRQVLLVTDPGLRKAGHEQRAIDSLEAARLKVAVFDEVRPNPTTDDVDRCLKVARDHGTEVIVGLGGGSSLDCAKGANFLLSNGGRMEDYWGVGKATGPMLPMLAVPTTCGTGSEAQSFALIANATTHMKMACGDKQAACRVALLDPELTLSQPRAVTAATGIDALSHALETYVTRPRNPISQMFSRQAWSLLSRGFAQVLAAPDDLDARAATQLGAHLAGAAIENSMLGAAHALANPLSAHFDTTHGYAVGVMLPWVIRFNAAEVDALYAELLATAGVERRSESAGDDLAEFVEQLIRSSGAPHTLQACGVDPELFPTLAAEAAQQWTGTFNPRTVDATAFEMLYRQAWRAAAESE